MIQADNIKPKTLSLIVDCVEDVEYILKNMFSKESKQNKPNTSEMFGIFSAQVQSYLVIHS